MLVLVAALLSGLACSLVSPAVTPTDFRPTLVVPDQRPADFTVHYYWSEGSLPPPYHYEYTINVATNGTVTLTYFPDYPNDDVPVWTETVSLDAAQLDALYAELNQGGLFTTDWPAEGDPPVGGSSDTLTATANGVTVTVPAYVIADLAVDADALAATLNALIPQATWDDLNAQREQYIAEHS